MLKAHVGAKCVSVRCSFFVARCSTSTARLSRAASLLAVDVREAERLRGLNPPIGCHSQVPSRKGEGEERKKERKKEKKKKTVPHSDKKTKQKEDGRKGGIRSSGGASAFKFINKLDVLFVHLHNPRD